MEGYQQLLSLSTCGLSAPSNWLKNVGSVEKPSHGPDAVRFNVWVPVPVGEGCPWMPNGSRVLNDFSAKSFHIYIVYMLQYMFLCTELCAENGTPEFTVDPERSPALYNRLLEAYCRIHMGCPKPTVEDRKLLSKYTKASPTFNKSVPELLNVVKERLMSKKGDAEEDEDDEDNQFARPPVPVPAFPGDPSRIPDWIERTNAILRDNPTISPDVFPEGVRHYLTFPSHIINQEERDEALRRAANVTEWITNNLQGFSCHLKGISRSADTQTVYTGETTRLYLLSLPLIDGLTRRMWPLEDLDDDVSSPMDNKTAPSEVSNSKSQFLPKVQVSWFLLEKDKKDGVFCFSVLDPLWTFDYPYRFLLQHTVSDTRKGKSRWNAVVDPLAHLRHLREFHIANTFSEVKYEEMVSYFYEGPRARFDGYHIERADNKLFLPSVMTLSKSLDILEKCGVTNTRLFLRCMKNPSKSIRFPSEFDDIILSYVLHPKMCFWYHPRYIGIGFTHWPNEQQKDNVALDLITGKIKIVDNVLQTNIDPAEKFTGRLADLAIQHTKKYENPLMDKEQLNRQRPNLLHYQTGDQMMHWQAEADAAWDIIMQLLPDNPRDDPVRYAEYCRAVKLFRESCLDKFCSIWTLDGMIVNKPVSPSRKAVIEYVTTFLSKISDEHKKTLTCHLPFLDDQMTIYGNLCITKMMCFGQGKTIINCKIPFMAGALQSTFDKKRNGQPKFHIQLCGPKEAGKTFPLLIFIASCNIKGTFQEMNSASKMANHIDGHIGPRIGLCDEPPKYVTNAKEEDKHYDEVQDMKAVLTSHQHNRTILKQVEVDGNTVRIQSNMHSDDATTWAYCTNQPRDKNHPLASRMFQLTVPKPILPPEEYQFDPKAAFASDVKTYFRIEQALAVEIYDAIICGVIPDIDMWLPQIVTGRLFSILRNWNVIDCSKGDRSRQIIFAFIRHQIILRGIAACRHVPGGALYKVPYKPVDVHKVGPYLVCTLEIIYLSVHMMMGELIDEDASNVLKACCKLCSYDPEKSAYWNYKNQETADTIPFKKLFNGKAADMQDDDANNNRRYLKDKWNLDLNMLMLEGTPAQIATRVAPHTNPPLEAFQVESVIFTGLCGKAFPPINGKKYAIETKNRLEAMIYREEPFFDVHNPNQAVVFDEESFLMDCKTLVAAEYHKEKRGMLFFCPSLIPLLDVEVVERAFNLATVCAKYPRQKVLKGIVYDEYPDLFKVSVWNDAFVNSYVNKIDSDHPDAPVPRSEGIAISTKEKLSEMEQNMLLSVQLDPSRQDHDDAYWNVIQSRSAEFHKIEDWEQEAAERVAHRHGTPLDEIVYYTDREVYKRYLAYCDEHPEAAPVDSEDMCYPVSILEKKRKGDETRRLILEQMSKGKDIRISSELTEDQLKNARIVHGRSNRNQNVPKKKPSVQQRRQQSAPVVPVTMSQRPEPQPSAGELLLRRIGLN